MTLTLALQRHSVFYRVRHVEDEYTATVNKSEKQLKILMSISK